MVDNEVVKNTKFHILKTKVNSLEDKIPDATTSVHINQYSADKQNLERKKWILVNGWIPDMSVLVTTTVLNTKLSEVENKIPDTSALMTTAVLITKISENDNNIPDDSKYITPQEFNNSRKFCSKIKAS